MLGWGYGEKLQRNIVSGERKVYTSLYVNFVSLFQQDSMCRSAFPNRYLMCLETSYKEEIMVEL